MSKFSREVRHVMDKSIVKTMTTTMDDILKREPYSIDYSKLQADNRKLSKLTLIYDYLQEYVIGNEEVKPTELWSISRLAGPMVIDPMPIDYQARLNTYTAAGSDIKITVNGGTWPFNGGLKYGYNAFFVQYKGECTSVRLIHDQKMIGAVGNEVGFQNVFIDLPGEFEFRVYDEHKVLITTVLIKYTVTDVPSICLNKLDTCGLAVTLVLP